MNPFDKLIEIWNQVVASIMDYTANYIFGILALVFWLRAIDSLLKGKIAIIAIILAVVLTAMAISMGQHIWKHIPEMFS